MAETNLDYVIQRIADVISGIYTGADYRGGQTNDISFRAGRLQSRETFSYCNGLLEGATGVRWRADRSEPMLIIFRRSI